MTLDIDAIEARADAASTGPWKRYETMQADTFVVGPRGLLLDGAICGPTYDRENCEFVAHARTDVPALIAEIRRLRQRPTTDDVADRIESVLNEIDVRAMAHAAIALFPAAED